VQFPQIVRGAGEQPFAFARGQAAPGHHGQFLAGLELPEHRFHGAGPQLVVLPAAGMPQAADGARTGQGPSLIESKFYRFSAHGNAITVPPVPTQFPKHESVEVYGRKTEYEAAKGNDPIVKFRRQVIERSVLSEPEARDIENEVRAEMEEAVRFGLASPLPVPEDALKYVYA